MLRRRLGKLRACPVARKAHTDCDSQKPAAGRARRSIRLSRACAPTVTRKFWHRWLRQELTIDVPSVLHSAWRAEDGSVGIIMVNVSEEVQDVAVTVPDYLGTGPCSVEVLRDGQSEGVRHGLTLPAEVRGTIGPDEIILVITRPK